MHIFFTVIFAVLGLLAIRLLQKHLHEAKLLRLREMVHVERMAALERDLPMPTDESEALNELLRDGPGSAANSQEARVAQERWIRLAALCLGLTSLLGGIGLAIGLAVQSNAEAAGMWGIGLIPALIGIGLLIFVRLSRGFGSE
jgi:hypothetical protein